MKPLDVELLKELGKTAANLITVEEHSMIGGLGSAVADFYSDKQKRPLVHKMGIEDEYCHGAAHETILDRYGLTQSGIIKKVLMVQGGNQYDK